MVMVMLALAGSVLVGNDFQFGSLPFYLSKPLSSWHYLLGKCLAVAVFVNLMTTLPALVLFVQYGVLNRSEPGRPAWDYFVQNRRSAGRHPRLRPAADRVPEPDPAGGGQLAAADGAAHHGLDDPFHLLALAGRRPGGRAALRCPLAAARPVERHVPGGQLLFRHPAGPGVARTGSQRCTKRPWSWEACASHA